MGKLFKVPGLQTVLRCCKIATGSSIVTIIIIIIIIIIISIRLAAVSCFNWISERPKIILICLGGDFK